MQPIAVYDTNVLISGMVWGGVPYDCIELAKKGSVVGITCAEILDEFEEKLTIKLNFTSSQASEIVTTLLSFLQTVKIAHRLKGVTPDPDDDKVIECAVVAGATHVVTGDRKHLLPLQSYQGILIVKAADLLAQFR
ncbi:putative toxin-antitoxin system toxin component, PIN family [Candidatus Poribacteria bacterium]|nr:MAG: putative toxin-antitoxin system toxin component, PIN family [Candidatus Poribacteria bacterium]